MAVSSKSHLARDIGLILIGLIILFVLFMLARAFTLPGNNIGEPNGTIPPPLPEEESDERTAKQDLIRVTSPAEDHALVTSPLVVRGEARGTWYFEANFPVRLVDANGDLIAQWYAEAQGEWMTEEFVPFVATIEFSSPTTPTGWLVLEKSNPSGDPKFADELRIPVRFR